MSLLSATRETIWSKPNLEAMKSGKWFQVLVSNGLFQPSLDLVRFNGECFIDFCTGIGCYKEEDFLYYTTAPDFLPPDLKLAPWQREGWE